MFQIRSSKPWYSAAADGPDRVLIKGTCVRTLEKISFTVPLLGWLAYNGGGGALVQEAFPDLSADQREFLISGIGPKGWETIFLPGEEE